MVDAVYNFDEDTFIDSMKCIFETFAEGDTTNVVMIPMI